MKKVVQHVTDWNQRYLTGQTPWSDRCFSDEHRSLVKKYIPEGSSMLDAGCGLGTDTIGLAEMGYNVIGLDVSSIAIEKAKVKASQNNLAVNFQVGNIIDNGSALGTYLTVYDKGCFHSFANHQSRRAFVASVHQLLEKDGYWISISGSRDSENRRMLVNVPQVTKGEILSSTEGFFETIEIKLAHFGVTKNKTDFQAWQCVFKKI